jgi:hypothetical protein
MTLGSDANHDIYERNGGVLSRIATGGANTVFHGGNTFSAIAQGDVTNGYVDLSSTQASIGGNKTFTGNLTTSANIIFTNSGFSSNISSNTLTANRSFSLPDKSGTIATLGDIVGPLSYYPHVIFTPSTGGTVNLVGTSYNIINPSGALAALTVNLPGVPTDGLTVYIKFTQNVTTVTYTGGTVVDGVTAPTAGGLTVLVYDSGTSSWY